MRPINTAKHTVGGISGEMKNLMSHRDIKSSDMPESWRIGSILGPGQAPLIARAGHRLLCRTLAAM
jgi:hypothetical protein